MWVSNDTHADYKKGILDEFRETVETCAQEGADIGGNIGSIFGSAGEAVGRTIGTVVGTAKGVLEALNPFSNRTYSSGGGGCYITTATCEEYGKPDDCYELTMFRRFRDNWLLEQPDGKALIDRYYATAPKIVEQINQQPDRKEIYRYIKNTYLSKCLAHIEAGENEQCKNVYIDMMNYLYQEQRKWQ